MLNKFIPSAPRHLPTTIRLVGLLCVGALIASESFAQSEIQADPRGWMANAQTSESPVGINRAGKIESEPSDKSALIGINEPAVFDNSIDSASSIDSTHLNWANPSVDVRCQIGLATFDEPVPSDDRSDSSGTDPAPTSGQPKLTDHSLAPPRPLVNRSSGNTSHSSHSDSFENILATQTESLIAPGGIQGSIKFALLLGALSLAPAIILMTTCYIRVVVVLSLLKQAFGGQQLPPAQVLTALSIFITLLIMAPVWNELKTNAIDPYSANEIDWDEAWNRGVAPIKSFMARQIELAGNGESVAVFYKYADVGSSYPPDEIEDVPLNVLIPAFMISELKVAFLLGFQIYLPFLVMDLIVSSVTVSMGMLMLPPQMVSFPLKLILFVLVDGWNLVIGMLLQSFGAML